MTDRIDSGTAQSSVVSHTAELDDAALVEHARQGDETAFDHLVRRHQQQVYAVAVRMLGDLDEAKDVAQDAFVRAYRSIATFRGEAKFSTWMVSITMNLCRNRRRWWARRRRVIAGSIEETLQTEEKSVVMQVIDPLPTPAEVTERAELRVQLLGALAQLDQDSREVVVLRDVHGWSYEEIAQAAGCELGTVKSRLNRARLKLCALLNGQV